MNKETHFSPDINKCSHTKVFCFKLVLMRKSPARVFQIFLIAKTINKMSGSTVESTLGNFLWIVFFNEAKRIKYLMRKKTITSAKSR